MTEPQARPRPPYLWAAATAILVLAIYFVTLGPTIAFWDTAEYIAAAKVLGIPHPPGNPLFVILAHTWGLLPIMGEYAARINLFAAMTSAAAAGFWFLVAERWLQPIVSFRPARLASAFAGVLVGATMWTVWNQSTVNEKVYTVSILSMAMVMWVAVHWGDDTPGPHRDRWLILIAYLLTLSSTNHMMGMLAAPAVGVYVLWTDTRAALRPWVLMLGWMVVIAVSGTWTEMVNGTQTGMGVGVVTAGLLIYALVKDGRNPMLYTGILAVVVGISLNYIFLPMRAAQFPPINEGEPTTWQALLDVLNRVQYGKPSVLDRQADIFSQFGNYLQYWNWQFARDWSAARAPTTIVFTGLGLLGLGKLLTRDRRAGIAAVTMLFALTVALIFYLNFRYGFSMHPEQQDLVREVRERDYFFVCSFAYFGTLIAVGFGTVLQYLADFARSAPTNVAGSQPGQAALKPVGWGPGWPLLVIALVPLVGNRLTASRAHETTPRDFAVDLLQSVEPYSILITAGDNDTFPLWFAQEVEGVRRDVTLANLSLLNTEWHLKQVRRREVDEFDPAAAIPLWQTETDIPPTVPLGDSTGGTAAPAVRPTYPALSMTEEELMALPELMPMPEQRFIRIGDIELQLGDQYLDRSTLATIFLIRDNLGKRPIYFSWSAGGMPDQSLGLTPYLVSEGLVRRVSPQPIVPSGPIVFTRGMGYVDLERTRELLWNAYRWQSPARLRPRGWVDTPSSSILQLYAIIYGGMGAAFREVGDTASALRADSIAIAVQSTLMPTLP